MKKILKGGEERGGEGGVFINVNKVLQLVVQNLF